MIIIARANLGDAMRAAGDHTIKRCILRRGVWIIYVVRCA